MAKGVLKSGTKSALVHIVVDTGGLIGLETAANVLSGVSDFLEVAWATEGDFQPGMQVEDTDAIRRLRNGPDVDPLVKRIRYGSPFEVLIYFTGTATAISTVAISAISVFNKFQDARAGKAQTDLTVETARLEIEAVRRRRNQLSSLADEQRKVHNANIVGNNLAQLKFIDDDDWNLRS